MYYPAPQKILITLEEKYLMAQDSRLYDCALNPEIFGESQMKTKMMPQYFIKCYKLFQLLFHFLLRPLLWSQDNKPSSSLFASSKPGNGSFKNDARYHIRITFHFVMLNH